MCTPFLPHISSKSSALLSVCRDCTLLDILHFLGFANRELEVPVGFTLHVDSKEGGELQALGM